MDNATSFQCPNCGSPITITGPEAQIKCAYCGTSVIVPEELRQKPKPAVSQPYVYDFSTTPKVDDEVLETVGKVGKIAAGATVGITAVSVIFPIALTCVILGVVGFVMYSAFSGVRSAIPLSFLPTEVSSFATAAPTETEAPTEAPTPIPLPATFPKTLVQDNFTNPNSGWERARNANYTLEYKDGNYHAVINEEGKGQIVWLEKDYSSSSIEVDVQQNSGPDDAHFGVACRLSDAGNLYSFEFSQDGSYGIYKYSEWSSDALDQGKLDPNSIKQDQFNHLEGICDGDTLTLILNDQPLLQVVDSSYTTGGVGIIVSTGESGAAGIDAFFGHFLVKGPKS